MFAMVALAASAQMRGQCSNSWLPVGADHYVRAMTTWDPDGAGPQTAVVVVGGQFTMIGGIPANGIAIHDPVLGTWSAMGTPQLANVRSIAVMANGDLIACGDLGTSSLLARWNGSSWAPFATGMSGAAGPLLPLPNGDLIVGGSPIVLGGTGVAGVARWNGASWSPMPGLGAFSSLGMGVLALAVTSSGDIVAGGMFSCSGGENLARWNGAGWTSINPFPPIPSVAFDPVFALAPLPNDGLVAAAHFGGVMQRNGATWSQLVGGVPVSFYSSMSVASNGDVVAGDVSLGLVRWNGSAWSTFPNGLAGFPHAFANGPNGDLWVGGNFITAGGLASPNLARVTTSCPASVATYGSGCAGTGGLNVLSAVTLPWIDSTFRARAVGMPQLALVLSVYGFTTQSIPFASVFPQGLPGCTILMNGDLIDVLLPSAGVVDTQIALPDLPALAGRAFHHYVVPFEVDLALSITAITNSNALTCTVGAF
ncbi:MAG TPA: hypothetical protein VF384_09605 [Planctomycetota bacterium]